MTPVKYKIIRGILIAGVVLGFGSGFAHLGARRHCKDGRGHCSHSCPDGSRWDRNPDRTDREVAPPATSATPETRAAAPAPTPTAAPAQ